MNPPRILTQRQFHAILANRIADRRRLVARIETSFRKALGVEEFNDDAIVEATLRTEGQTPFERAGLAVVRACIGFREAPDANASAWLDRIGFALADAEPATVAGVAQRERQRQYGEASGAARDPRTKHPDLARLIRLAIKRGEDPREYVAEWTGEYDIPRATLYRMIAKIRTE